MMTALYLSNNGGHRQLLVIVASIEPTVVEILRQTSFILSYTILHFIFASIYHCHNQPCNHSSAFGGRQLELLLHLLAWVARYLAINATQRRHHVEMFSLTSLHPSSQNENSHIWAAHNLKKGKDKCAALLACLGLRILLDARGTILFGHVSGFF